MASITWNQALSGDWTQGTDWTGNASPGTGDDAIISVAGAAYIITISTAISANSLTVSTNSATISENNGASLTLTGALTLSSGTVQLNGTTSVGSFTQSGGDLDGTGTVTVTGATALSGATMTGTGTTVAQGPVSLAGALYLAGGRTFENQGSLAWTSGSLGFGYNPQTGYDTGAETINNDAGATFDDQFNGSMGTYPGSTAVFNNAGLFRKSAGTGTTTIGAVFDNTGSIEVDAGTLSLTGGGTNSGTARAVTGALIFSAGSFNNQGTIEALNNSNVTFASGAVNQNNSAGILAGGVWETVAAAQAATMTITGAPITTDAANIVLSGAGASFLTLNASNQLVTLESSLTSIAAGGELDVLAGRGYTTANTFTDVGVLKLGGGTFDATSLSVGLGGRLVGFGTVSDALANAGDIQVAGGTLDISGPVTGAGSATIGANATLELGNASAQGVGFAGLNATLELEHPTSFSGAISGIEAGGIIDLVNVNATATINGSTLAVTISGGPTLTWQVGGALSSLVMTTQTDNAGGTDIVFEPTASAYASARATINAPSPVNLGNARVGGVLVQPLSVTNSAMAPAEGLDASVAGDTGAATASGAISVLAAGQSDGSDITVGLDTSSAGAKTGAVTLGFATDGADTDGNPASALASQTVSITGAVYREAAASVTAPTNVIMHVSDGGGTETEALTVANTDPTDGYSENLLASATGAVTGALLSGSGATADVVAGGTTSTSLTVSFSTANAGTVSGTAAVALISDGTGVDGLGMTSVGTTAVQVSVTIDNYATAAIQQTGGAGSGLTQTGDVFTLNFGAIQLGSSALTAGFDILNTASGPADLLSGSFAGGSGGVFSNNGFNSFFGLSAGAAGDPSSITFTPNAVGAFTETLTLTPNGYNASGFSRVLPAETLVVSGTVLPVWARAQAQINTTQPVAFGAHHVADTGTTQSLSITNAATSPAEALDASVASVTAGLTGSGSFNLLAAGQINTTSILVGIDTGTPGAKNGDITLAFTSDGQGTSGFGQTQLANQTIAVTGSIYALAKAEFGDTDSILHVGDPETQTLTVGNVSGYGQFSEGLIAMAVGAANGVLSASGTTGLIPDGAQDATSLTYDLPTNSAGYVEGDVQVDLTSDGTGTSGLGQTTLPSGTVPIDATIDNYATAAFQKASGVGSLSQVGNTYALNLGAFGTGTGDFTANLGLLNTASGPADWLNGTLVASGDTAFANIGLGGFGNVGAGGAAAFSVDFSITKIGTYSETITFAGTDGNASGFSEAMAGETLVVTGTVVAAAQPVLNTASPIDFGNVRQGTTVQRALISVSNAAPAGGASLEAGVTSTLGAATGNGATPLLAPGATDSTDLMAGLNTGTAGVQFGSVTLGYTSYASAGSGPIPDGTGTVDVRGTVYRQAAASLAGPPIIYLHVGDTASEQLTVDNTDPADGYSENLLASVVGVSGALSGGGGAVELAPGARDATALTVALAASAPGIFTGV